MKKQRTGECTPQSTQQQFSKLLIRPARTDETDTVASILGEAGSWLEEKGEPLWRQNELDTVAIAADVEQKQYWIAFADDEPAGVVRFQLEDTLFWPDEPNDRAAYVHRLAIRRKFAGGGLSKALLRWASEVAFDKKRQYLRLDTAAARPKLRKVYEDFGFRFHSDRQVGPYHVARYQMQLF